MKRFTILAGFLVVLITVVEGTPVAKKATVPNLRLEISQRIFPPSKAATVSLATYNLKRVILSVHPIQIESLVPDATLVDVPDDRRNPRSVCGRLAKMSLPTSVRSWPFKVKTSYPDSWMDHTIKLPKLRPGIYAIRARGGGIEMRTWLAISTRALLVKRSPEAVKAWLVEATNGEPVAGVSLALYDAKGYVQSSSTEQDGTASFKPVSEEGPLWIASKQGPPAFTRTIAPEKEKPYKVYVYTDRPVYRPGQRVLFRGTVRAVRHGVYSLPGNHKVKVQIKTRGDTVIYDEELPLNNTGSFTGEFQLAPEPPLGTYSLEMILNQFREYSSFEVEAYRKPEFEVAITSPVRCMGGKSVPVTISANYFFGSPVSGGKVNYSVSFRSASQQVPSRVLTAAGLGSAGSDQREENYSGQGKLDNKGQLMLTIPTRFLCFDRQVSISASVTDLSLRTLSAEAVNTLITSAQFRLSLSPAREQYQPGDLAEAKVLTKSYDDQPVRAKVRVILIESLTDREGRNYQKHTERSIETNQQGQGAAFFRVLRPGTYHLEGLAFDSEKNPIYDSAEFEVTKEKPQEEWPTLEVSLDKNTYLPGETAVLKVRSSLVKSWALVTLEGNHLYHCQVCPIRAKEFQLKLPVIRDYQPGVIIRMTTVTNGEILSDGSRLIVPASDRKLNLGLTSNKKIYQPGETATYDIVTRDYQGRGVSTDVGLSVVDAALYAIRSDSTTNPFDFFWEPQMQRVNTDFSLAATYPGGGYQHLPAEKALRAPAPAGDKKAEVRVRRLFVDTACWSPSIITDQEGRGQISFTVPDNLTTWRATARALSQDTKAGEARNDIKVTLPMLVRQILPRFYVQNDEATVAAIIHNYSGSDQPKVDVKLTAQGAQVQGNPEQNTSLANGALQRLTWNVKMPSAEDQVRFLVKASAGENLGDAMESTLALLPDGVRRVEALAGMTQDRATVEIPLPELAMPRQSKMELTLSPSVAGAMLDALDYLVGYPHGCAEQTMDRFLPNILFTRALKTLDASAQLKSEPAMLKRYVSFGLQKLLRYQHQDGGWHWWEFDESDPFISAYVVYGLAMARDAGYPLAGGPLPRGVDYLYRALQREEGHTAQCYLLWALSYANLWEEKRLKSAVGVAEKLVAEHEKLDLFSRASLALALDRLGQHGRIGSGLLEKARSLAGELEAQAVVTGTASHWTANATGDGSWLDSDVEVTAQVLQMLLTVKPISLQILPAVRWLMAAREGKQWSSTKDTAAAVLALTTYLKQAKELHPEMRVSVRIGDQPIQEIGMTKAQLISTPIRVNIPEQFLKAGSKIQVQLDKEGTGNLYWTAQLSYVIPSEQVSPQEKGIEIKRYYRLIAENPVTASEQPAGSLLEVTTEIISKNNYRYCLLDEPIPAGCEIIVSEDEQGWRRPVYDRREVWDDRLVYYFDYLSKGTHTITYHLRAEAPGLYRVRPSVASLMYFPEIRGEGRPVKLRVTE